MATVSRMDIEGEKGERTGCERQLQKSTLSCAQLLIFCSLLVVAVCDECGALQGVWQCAAGCEQVLCASCDKFVHAGGALQAHDRQVRYISSLQGGVAWRGAN